MQFFDKKEEVIELIMTKKGKELFSQGRFTPYYYSFSDADITYDANFSEQQNDIVERIKETPVIKGPTGLKHQGNAEIDLFINKTESTKMKCEIGSKIYGNQFAPSWDIKFLNSPKFQYVGTDLEHIKDKKRYEVSFISDIDSDKSNTELIPQIDIATVYEIYLYDPGKLDPETILNYYLHKDKDLLVQASEYNALESDEFSEYELEIFHVKDSGKIYEALDNEKLKDHINIYFDKLADLIAGNKVADIYGPQVGADESTC